MFFEEEENHTLFLPLCIFITCTSNKYVNIEIRPYQNSQLTIAKSQIQFIGKKSKLRNEKTLRKRAVMAFGWILLRSNPYKNHR